MSEKFVNLHSHSYYSILEATMSPKVLLETAHNAGCPAVALTDTGAGHGLIDFVESARQFEGLKPILGVEIFVARDSRFEKRSGIDGKEGHLVLLATSDTGYQNLVKIISIAHLQGHYEQPRVDWETLEKYKKGLICLTGSVDGLMGKTLLLNGEAQAKKSYESMKTVFGSNLYLEACADRSETAKTVNDFVLALHQETKTPLVVTSNARFATPADEESADTLYCIGQNQSVLDPSRKKVMMGQWFKNWSEICDTLNYFPVEVLEAARLETLAIAKEVNLEIQFGQSLLPHFEVEAGLTPADQLKKDCETKIAKRYSGKSDQKMAQERLEYELSIISKMGFDSYFLIVADFIDFAKENGIAVGPGRGSAAGSIVSYLLGITNIDPLKYELLFERFLNPERISMPDIDIDFSDERRDEVLQYVIEKYGTERVSKVCTFGTLAAKAALKDVARAHGIAFAEANAMTKLLPNRPGFSLEEAKDIKDFSDFINKNAALKKVFEVAERLEGCVRHVSVHACAVIIGADDLTKHAPIQWAPGAEEVKITQFPYQQLENLGLLKMDFLGLKNLSVLEKALQNIELSTGQNIDMNQIPLDDTKTFEMLSEGETTGVFQFESPGMRRYLKELKPTELEDLVAMNALYRPGPMEMIPEYIKRKNDSKLVKYEVPELESFLKSTYGIIVYQEQVQRVAQDFAGFSLGEGYLMIKAVGKKIPAIMKEQKKRFIDGALKQGHKKKDAEKIFDLIEPFAGYGFNKSHSTCYARIAYETAYLRANYPVEFMAAMMTTDRNNTDRIVLEMNECQQMGIEVLPPSVNESGSHFTVVDNQAGEILEDDEKLDKSIRFGLTAIKGLGEETVDQIIFERNRDGIYESLQDFAKRVPAKLMNKKTLEALAFSGAFDHFGNRKAVVDSLDELAKFAKDHQAKKEAGQMGLFGGTDESAIEFTLKETVATKDDILRWERESMGLFVSDHPLKGLNDYFEKYGSLIGRLNEAEDKGQRRTLHGLVIKARRIITKRGKNMAVLELEDTSGKIECAVFPNVFDSIPPAALKEEAFLRIRGKIESREGTLNCIVDEIKLGDLVSVQNSPVFTETEKKEKPKEHYQVTIPGDTVRAKIDTIKLILSQHKVVSGGETVVVNIDKQSIELPFRVDLPGEKKEEIEALLQ